MKKRKRKNYHRLIQSGIGSFLVLAFIMLIIILVTAQYTTRLNKTFRLETEVYLSEISDRNAKILEKEIDNELSNVKNLAEILSEFPLEMETILSRLESIVELDGYVRMGIILKNGETYCTGKDALYLGDRIYFKEALEGNVVISDVLSDRAGNDQVNVYAAPVRQNGEITGVFFATRSISYYHEILDAFSLGDGGRYFIANCNGDVLVSSGLEKKGVEPFKNLFLHLKEKHAIKQEDLEEVKHNMMQSKVGFLEYKDKETCNMEYLNYMPIGINEWYILSVIPETAISSKVGSIMNFTILMFAGIIISFFLLLLSNVIIENKHKAILKTLAYQDSLTGIRNKVKFNLDAETLFENNKKRSYALIQLDIAHFKYINHVFGFEEGNKVLISIAQQLENFIRPGELCARTMSDNFVLMLYYDATEKEIEERMEELNERITSYIRQGVYAHDLILYFGIYCVEDASCDIDGMLDRALLARNSIKGYHKMKYAFYNDEIREQMMQEKSLESDLNEALGNGNFEVFYQPKFLVQSEEICGAEALVRWRREDGSIAAPDSFIPICEKNGMIIDLDLAVFEGVCKDITRWRKQGRNLVPVSVNLSRLHLYDAQFFEKYMEIIERYQTPKELIEFELTENIFFDDTKVMISLMKKLHTDGFMLSIDDFGSGYSSLNLLTDLPVDILKLDKEFFNKKTDEERGRSVVQMIVELAGKLKIEVIAEGVETKEQLDFLKEIGCNMAQGYYFSKPIPADSFQEFLK